ncbi:MAG: acetate--CoA ligase family protein [Sphingopyxis sp.]|nr:acetate--CoA ligase family protein [Sphingopyxis sp.]
MTDPTNSVPAKSIDRLLRPSSVAIIGASATPGALGATVLANLEQQGFGGDIHLVNPKRPMIGSRQALGAIDELPSGVDVAVLAIPRAAVLDSIRALAARGASAAIIFSAGFAEGGEEGLAEQREIARIADAHGMVIEGPNCLGLVNYVDMIPLTFVETPSVPLSDRQGVAIVSQSGAMAAVLAVTLFSRGIGVSYSISTGNEAASGVEDYVEYLIDDAGTKAIAMIVEQFRQPRRFLALAEKARAAGKPILLLHPGKSSAARESAATHTGAMAGDYALMRVKVERAGVLVADTLEELGDTADIVATCGIVPAGGAAVLTESGAFKALTLDLCETVGLPLPAIGDHDAPALRAALPPFVPVSNPVDLTAQALVDPDLYRRALSALLDDDRFGSVVFAIIQTDAATCALKFPPIIDAIRTLQPAKPVIFAGMDDGARVPPDYIVALRDLNVPYFPTPDRVFRAMAQLNRFAARDANVAAPAAVSIALPAAGVIPEHRAKELLGPLGILFPAARLARTPAEAEAIAAELGYPVVLKAQSPALSHKSDAGGVIVGVGDGAAVAAGWARMQASVAAYSPGLVLDGILVEAMGKRGLELIIGARNDPEWGPIILAGLGGVQAEIWKDVRLLPTDLSRAAIIRELHALRSGALLEGFRGSPAMDVGAVADMVLALGAVLEAGPAIREIDLNPVVVYPDGEGAVALDALMLIG